jgi:hypothetical protein
MADKIKDFVANGNVAIFYPDAFCYDWNTAKDLKNSPGYGLDKLFGARIKKRIFGKEKTIKILEDISPSLKKGDVFQVRGLVTPLEKLEGGKVVAELADTGEPVIISANDGRTYYIGFVPGISYSSEMENGRKIRDLFSGMIEKSQIKKPVEIEKTQDSYLVYARMLHGKSYWLVALLNDHWKKQSVQAKLNFLPDGKLYDIIDVSKPGKPVVLKKKQPFETLLKNGINVKLEPLSGRVLIVRPSDMEIFVDCPEYELKALTLKQNINIVLPDNCSENLMDSVKKLQKTLLSKGSRSKILKADEIAIENTSALLKEKKCIIGEFKNKVLKTPDNLIIIGSTENNKLIQTLCKPGNYTYDKVLDDISLDYPGPGRGAIQIAESVNKAYYCPTDKSRDAVLIGGSDETGTVKAIDKFIEILQR